MNKDKEIWEWLGHKWHEWKKVSELYHDCICSCGYKSMLGSMKLHCEANNPDLSTPAGTVLLLMEMMKREDYCIFVEKKLKGRYCSAEDPPFAQIGDDFITTPGKLRDAVWEWKERKTPDNRSLTPREQVWQD